MEYILSMLTKDLAKKILANKDTAIEYLIELDRKRPIYELSDIKKSTKTDEIWKLEVKYWDYHISKDIIRTLFRKTAKYRRGKESVNAISVLRDEWKKLNLGNFEWPCSQGDFDGFVQRINSLPDIGLIKVDTSDHTIINSASGKAIKLTNIAGSAFNAEFDYTNQSFTLTATTGISRFIQISDTIDSRWANDPTNSRVIIGAVSSHDLYFITGNFKMTVE